MTQAQQPEALRIADNLNENADLDAAEGGNPAVCKLERDAAVLLQTQHYRILELEGSVTHLDNVYSAAMRKVVELEQGKCLHQIAEPATTESVLIDGTAYVVHAEVAAELLRLHIELQTAPQAVQPAVPVLFVSCEQLESHTDHLASKAGRYLPARKTAVGKFTTPLYAHPAEGVPATVAVPDEFGTAEHWKEKAQYWAGVAHRLRSEALRGDPVDGITQPAAQGLTEAARSVLAERARQISAEGWTSEQDDAYNPGVLAEAGGIYALHAFDPFRAKEAPEGWPWSPGWWKPKDPRTNLVKAGALVLAEIERIDRTYAAQAKQGGAA